MNDISGLRPDQQARILKMQASRQTASSAPSGGSFDDAGPPYWNQASWDAFHAKYGSWPFGPQADGGYIQPTTWEGCPDWAYERMGLRKPPVVVAPRG